MVDNVQITPGVGAAVATDDVGGVQFQRVKLDVGGDGMSVPVVGSLPVVLDAASLAALETVSIQNFPVTQPVSLAAPVALDAASLAALETIQVGNFPATQPVSIAAPVALDGATLAALESISLNVPVALDATAMAALAAAATPATQPVSGPLTNAQLRAVEVPVSLVAPTNSTTGAYAASQLLKAAPGVLYGVSGYNSKTTEQFIQIHDATALPAEGVAPKVLVKVAPSSPFALDFGPRGRSFAVGIVVCNSSTGPIKTIGAPDCWFDGQVG